MSRVRQGGYIATQAIFDTFPGVAGCSMIPVPAALFSCAFQLSLPSIPRTHLLLIAFPTMSPLHALFLRCKRCFQSLGDSLLRKPARRSSSSAPPLPPIRASSTRNRSTAQLTLQRIYEQASGSISKKDDSRGDIISGIPAKGKPRLLLMGQRRYAVAILQLDKVSL